MEQGEKLCDEMSTVSEVTHLGDGVSTGRRM